MTISIHPKTHMGLVALVVSDLSRSLEYYEGSIGLRVLDRTEGRAVLGVGGAVGSRTLLELREQPGVRRSMDRCTGLYHFALRVPTRPDLGRVLRHLAMSRTRVDGASDHGVSEALYLSDPDGHGIEIYRDRQRSEWPYEGGSLRMVLDPLDVEGISASAETDPTWRGMPEGTDMGHVHLHVAEISKAEDFYVGVLGFDLIQRYGGQATFVAADGYHHHLGFNTWAGVGAPPPPEDAARLLWFEIVLPNSDAVSAISERAEDAGIMVDLRDGCRWLRDPSGNMLALTSEG